MSQAKQVYTVETILLQDGTEVEVKPLPIKRLRKAQKLINDALRGTPVLDENGEEKKDENGEVEYENSEETLLDAFIEVTMIVMQGNDACGKFLEPESGRELLEDTVDQETLFEIVKVSTGYDFLAFQQRVERMLEQQV